MTDDKQDDLASVSTDDKKWKARLKKRHAAEKRFRIYGMAAISIGLFFLVILFGSIVGNGLPAFSHSFVKLDIDFAESKIDPDGDRSEASLQKGNYVALVNNALYKMFPDVTKRKEKRRLRQLVSRSSGNELKRMVLADPALIGTTQPVWLSLDDEFDLVHKGFVDRSLVEDDRRVKDYMLTWYDTLQEQGRIESRFNMAFFTHGDSRNPELAGIGGALMGSFLTLIVTLLLSFPIGVAAAIYLEEFAPTNRLTDFIEVNINNLAAVPSIVFGLLGLAVYISLFGLPRSAPLVGGLVLTLMTLPTIIIASRAAIKSVPPSIREAAYGIGASKMQVVMHHVLPLAMPGMLTGAIIGMAGALGESAPLLMIGMVAFIVDIPTSFLDPATVLPVQIYLWSDSAEVAFVSRVSAAIMVLLGFLILMNGLAVLMRKKFERRW